MVREVWKWKRETERERSNVNQELGDRADLFGKKTSVRIQNSDDTLIILNDPNLYYKISSKICH